MKRWVLLRDNNDIDIVTTGGNQPDNALCECKDDWTVHNIKYDSLNKIVIYDPEWFLKQKIEEDKLATKKHIAEIKIKFVEARNQYWQWFLQRLPIILSFAIGLLVGIVAGQLHFH